MRLEVFNSKIPLERVRDVILITGDVRSLPADLELFLSWKIPHEVMAIGRSINHYPGNVRHWANVDGADSKWWAEHLPLKNSGELPIRHSLGELTGYDVDWTSKGDDWNSTRWNGSSSLFATHICLSLGYPKIVLAGCPMDKKGHWYWPETYEGPEWLEVDFRAWREFAGTPEARRVKSMSGFTGEILGAPTREWSDGI